MYSWQIYNYQCELSHKQQLIINIPVGSDVHVLKKYKTAGSGCYRQCLTGSEAAWEWVQYNDGNFPILICTCINIPQDHRHILWDVYNADVSPEWCQKSGLG